MDRLLTFISEKLKVDAHYLSKGFFWIGIATSAFFIANFLRSSIFATYLSPQTYGTYRYVLSIVEITTALGLSGASQVISRSVAQGYEGTYLRAMSMYLKRAGLSVLAACAAALYFAYKDNLPLAVAIGCAGLLSPLLQTVTMYSSLLEGKKLQSLNAKFQIFSTLVPTVILIFVVTHTTSLPLIILSYFLSYIGIHSIFALIAYTMIKPNRTRDPQSDSFTFHLSVMGTLATVTEQLDKVLLFHFIGPAQLAMYSLASSLPQQFNVFGKGLKVLISPSISNQKLSSIRKHIFRKASLIAVFSGLFFLVYIAAAPFIFRQFFAQYTDAILFSQVFSLSIFLMIAVPYRTVLLAHTCTRELYQTKIFTMITRIVSLGVLLPFFGLWGVISSYLLARFFEMFMMMYMVHFTISERTKEPALIGDADEAEAQLNSI